MEKLWDTIKETMDTLSKKSGWRCFGTDEYKTVLAMVAAHESGFGKARRQVGGGPARGVFQMEKATHDDIWQNFINFNKNLKSGILEMGFGKTWPEVENNDTYSAIMSACMFARFQAKNPVPKDLEAMAKHCKRFYNTEAGKATAEKYLNDYKKIEHLLV